LVAAGGAFGGKEDLTVQTHAALAAFLLKRPVKVKLNREESIKMSVKRHPTILDYQLSCDKNGKFTGLYARIIGDTGAYSSVGAPVMDRAATHAGGAYFIPNIDVKSSAVFTNNIPAGAMRGFGVNQVTFAIETLVDDLCEMGGFDRWQIRYDNALDEGLKTTSGHILKKEVGLKKTLLAVQDNFKRVEYAGIACAIKNCGIGNGLLEESKVLIHFLDAKHIIIYHGWSEMGQGIDTLAVQFLSEALNLNDEFTFEVVSSTEFETLGGSTTASRGTFLLGKAIIDAANKIKKDLKERNLSELTGNKYYGYYACDWTTPPEYKGDMVSHFAYSFATHCVLLDKSGKIEKVIAAHDSGRIVNKKLFEGQIHGGVVMGLGYATRENLKLVEGIPQVKSLGQLGLLRANEVPQDIEVLTIETEDTEAPFNAKGVGEISSIPISAAVANAYRNYDKYIYEEFPLKRK
jgi:CO/xanthine dehydrogenase Mo-binding subunit